jgi:hypothetical protein
MKEHQGKTLKRLLEEEKDKRVLKAFWHKENFADNYVFNKESMDDKAIGGVYV